MVGAGLAAFLLVPLTAIHRIRFVGAVSTCVVLFWCIGHFQDTVFRKYETWNEYTGHPLSAVKTALILVAMMVLTIGWFGLDIFMNPFLFDYNHGNGAYCSQVMHNLCSGLGPENTVKYNEVLFFKSNPYFYASAFSAVPHILPYLVLTPLYCLYPYPPMHVFAVVILVVICGSLGTYLAIRAVNVSRRLALIGAIGFCLLPWVERPVFMHGHFDVISFAVYPLVFWGLFAKRWTFFYFFIVLLGIINLPYTYSVMTLGAVVFLFFRHRLHGLATILIGVTLMLWEKSVVRESLKGIWDVAGQPSGTLMQIFLDLDLVSFLKTLSYHGIFFFLLFLTVAFIPFYGIRKKNVWNWPVIGILLFAVAGAVMGFFRSYDLASHRNANVVVPVYLSAFMVIGDVFRNSTHRVPEDVRRWSITMILCLFAGIVSMTLWFSHHYPWAGITNKGLLSVSYLRYGPVSEKYRQVLGKMREFIPDDASVAYRIDAPIQAYVTNRQKAWYLGYHPEGVEYYFIQTKDIVYIDKNLPPWREYLEKVEKDKDLTLLYKDDGLVIYKNSKPKHIPRLENVLGWGVLFRAMVPGK